MSFPGLFLGMKLCVVKIVYCEVWQCTGFIKYSILRVWCRWVIELYISQLSKINTDKIVMSLWYGTLNCFASFRVTVPNCASHHRASAHLILHAAESLGTWTESLSIPFELHHSFSFNNQLPWYFKIDQFKCIKHFNFKKNILNLGFV